jgi:hypothetical protein
VAEVLGRYVLRGVGTAQTLLAVVGGRPSNAASPVEPAASSASGRRARAARAPLTAEAEGSKVAVRVLAGEWFALLLVFGRAACCGGRSSVASTAAEGRERMTRELARERK